MLVSLDDSMTVQDAATALGVTPRRVQQLVNTGELRASRIGARVLIIDKDSLQAYQEMRRPPARPSATPSLLVRLLENALPPLAVQAGPLDCWAWKVMRRDPPQMAVLSEAISVVERHNQLATLERRIRKEHTVRSGRAHQRDDDQKLLDCLTEACAFAWAEMRGLGAPRFDYRAGMPDVHVPPDVWIEAKAIHESRSSEAAMSVMRRGGLVSGSVGPISATRAMNFLASLDKARQQLKRSGASRRVAFFNLQDVDVSQWADREVVLAGYAAWLDQVERADPGVSIVLCHAYNWIRPLRDPFAG